VGEQAGESQATSLKSGSNIYNEHPVLKSIRAIAFFVNSNLCDNRTINYFHRKNDMNWIILFLAGIFSGALITIQSVLNSGLGKRTGSLGSLFLLTITSIVFLIPLLVIFPGTASLKTLPGFKEGYLYLGGVLGVGIVVAPILLIPRIGATSTLTAIVIGQMVMALVVDQLGLFGNPRIEFTLSRFLGVLVLIAGAFLIARK
jgi:bacterial/archaeal transporter family-2 protein